MAQLDHPKKCSHDKTFDEPCQECELIGLREAINFARQRIARAQARIDEIEGGRGATFVCEVPKALGRVTKLKKRGGKIVAETASGIEMVLPTGKPAK